MIGFFKINDPLRIAFAFMLLWLIRVPVFVFDFPLLKPELTWFLIGEKINEGWVMYRDLDANTGVLSSLVYAITSFLAGRSHFFLFLMSGFLVFVQAIIFNFALITNSILKEKSFVPALIYIVLSSMFVDFYTLSPPMMATTFLIMALATVFSQMKQKRGDASFFMIGFYTGVATLFYSPSFLFVILFVFAVLLYLSGKPRILFLVFLGVLFPLATVGLFYYVNGGLGLYLKDVLLYSFTELDYWYLDPKVILAIAFVPTCAVLWSSLKLSSATGYVNYQQNARVLISLFLVAGALAFFISPKKSAYHLFLLLPAMAFLIADFFLNQKDHFKRELQFFCFAFTVITLGYTFKNSPLIDLNLIDSDRLLVDVNKSPKIGKVLVLGDDVDYYYNNTLATGYLNWQVAKQHFRRLDNLPRITAIDKRFHSELPDAIIDKVAVMPKIFQRIPALERQYYLEREGVYRRK